MPTPITDPKIRHIRLTAQPNERGCRLWLGKPSPAGYGTFFMIGMGSIAAHRAAWALFRGPIPKGKLICHKCDVPNCVNPSHLYVGTQADNMRDKMNRGRENFPVGERSSTAKLTADQVRYIRSSDKGTVELAREFGVWHSAISKIRLRQRWKHI